MNNSGVKKIPIFKMTTAREYPLEMVLINVKIPAFLRANRTLGSCCSAYSTRCFDKGD
jgi:hypothetical protein